MIKTAEPRGVVSVLTAAAVCLLVPFAAPAQPVVQAEDVGSASAGEVEPLGYRLEGEEVVFAFDCTQHESATRGDNGQPTCHGF